MDRKAPYLAENISKISLKSQLTLGMGQAKMFPSKPPEKHSFPPHSTVSTGPSWPLNISVDFLDRSKSAQTCNSWLVRRRVVPFSFQTLALRDSTPRIESFWPKFIRNLLLLADLRSQIVLGALSDEISQIGRHRDDSAECIYDSKFSLNC